MILHRAFAFCHAVPFSEGYVSQDRAELSIAGSSLSVNNTYYWSSSRSPPPKNGPRRHWQAEGSFACQAELPVVRTRPSDRRVAQLSKPLEWPAWAYSRAIPIFTIPATRRYANVFARSIT
jgi:hypothetical protein